MVGIKMVNRMGRSQDWFQLLKTKLAGGSNDLWRNFS